MLINHEEFTCKQAIAANRLIDYYDGNQLKYVQAALDGSLDGGFGRRYNWQERGYIPRMRNVVKPIVEKSAGTLFTKMPRLEILPSTSPTARPVVDARFNELMTIADFQEFGHNWNNYSRLLKSICVLQQKVVGTERTTEGGVYRFDEDLGDTLVLTMLHRGNSVVEMNQTRTVVTKLAYITNGCPDDEEWSYRLITPAIIVDVIVRNGAEYPQEPIENVDGFVPAFMHYDVNKPRTGVWHHIPEDIRSLQEMVNSHITDLEYAVAIQKQQPMYTTGKVVRPDDNPSEYERVGEKVPSTNRRSPLVKKEPDVGGIGSIVYLTPNKDGSAPMAEHKGPDADLLGQEEIIKGLVAAVAEDWSVNMKAGGAGAASSGFQLIVEEMDNLILREQRAVSFKASLRKFYSIVKRLYPELTDGELQVDFGQPHLPVNQKEVEELWEMRIAGGRATIVDYLMHIEGLSKAEALTRAAEIRALNEAMDVEDEPADQEEVEPAQEPGENR